MLIEEMLALYCEIYAHRKYTVWADCRGFQCSSGWFSTYNCKPNQSVNKVLPDTNIASTVLIL
jgi:hypothetical protein